MSREQKNVLVLAMIMVFVAAVLFLPGLISAGDLEPSGPPGPTMYTLDEIYDKLDGIDNKLAPLSCEGAVVEKTGQIAIYAPGDDGNLQKGATWPNPRFMDNGDGTVTDNLTGLIWLKNANCFAYRTWAQALSECKNLADGSCDLTDGSVAGDWRLPNVKELQSLIHYGVHSPALPDTAGTGMWTEGDPFSGVLLNYYYWSSTTVAGNSVNAWIVYLSNGQVANTTKTSNYGYVWPVRGGQ